MDIIGPILDAIIWLEEQRIQGKLPRWVVPALVLPVAGFAMAGLAFGLIVGASWDSVVLVALLSGAVGAMISAGILLLYVNVEKDAGESFTESTIYHRENTIRAMTDETLLRIWSSDRPQGWSDYDLEVVAETLRARGLDVPERHALPRS